jgi:predicted acetyltransferase
MNISVILVTKNEKEILRNLLEKYDYEFSQYNDCDVNELGLYGYDYLDSFWTENNRFPYFIKVEDKLAGFIMVADYPITGLETNWTMWNFFVLYKYRKMGIGTIGVNKMFDNHKGKWGLMYHPKNIVSKKFWNKVVGEYTKGKYDLIKDKKEVGYEDGTMAEILVFET